MPTRGPGPDRLAACERGGTRYRDRAIANATARYDRIRHLPKLLGTTPQELADFSIEGRRILIARLTRLARNSARAGRAGHWTYDPNRHITILAALQAERLALAAQPDSARGEPTGPAGAPFGIST
ncbi:DUF6477 family protein [Methyloceanibacter sp. wino2]|uniref:DUF6477 family protein n=1 Tax=Methyloceanibacter sp. wino2 TaxID=2170729 RepID=UPI001ABBBE88|nr:DUF6477 family protein [Methyloceanibacter sp. wino2]